MWRAEMLVVGGAVVLLAARWAAELALEWLNRRHVTAHADAVPAPYRAAIDEPTYARAVDYALARSRFRGLAVTWETIVVSVFLFSGWLPRALEAITRAGGPSVGAQAAFLWATAVAVAAAHLPLAWYAQFRLEQRFGFNTTTLRVWWTDRAKGLALGAGLGYPLLLLMLGWARWTGADWWLWAWGTLMAVQAVLMAVGPRVILPWFNRLTPLAPGSLRDRLTALAERTGFGLGSVQVMDGSKRSRHSNAFFFGLGPTRRVVLFDTLLGQLSDAEVEAVVAHEIGHARAHHLPQAFGLSALAALGGFAAVAGLAQTPWFPAAFGFAGPDLPAACAAVGLLSGAVEFWFAPVMNRWSRRWEYAADAFAAQVVGGPEALIGALRRLGQSNLSNLTPHPWYSAVHHSHPTLAERERALRSDESRPPEPRPG